MATTNYDAFIEKMRLEGVSAYDASQFLDAKEAHRRDQFEEQQRYRNADSKTFYNLQDGQKLDHFRSEAEMRAAISSEDYKHSPNMREAIQRMAMNSPTITAPGRNTHGNGTELTDEQFISQSRKASDMEMTKQAFAAARGNAQMTNAIIESMLANRDGADRVEDAFSNEGPLNKASRLQGYSSIQFGLPPEEKGQP